MVTSNKYPLMINLEIHKSNKTIGRKVVFLKESCERERRKAGDKGEANIIPLC